MKRLLLALFVALGVALTSCTTAAYAYDSTAYYYDSYYGTTVIYIDNSPFYRYWQNDCWYYVAVPHDRWHFITKTYDAHHHHTHRHNPHLHGGTPHYHYHGGTYYDYGKHQNHGGHVTPPYRPDNRPTHKPDGTPTHRPGTGHPGYSNPRPSNPPRVNPGPRTGGGTRSFSGNSRGGAQGRR